jgi:DedD protein
MAKELTDDELNLRRKARRRLIGASALTLAVVVILPMVLESEPRPAGQDIDLRIPNPDKVGEFVPGVSVSEVAEAMPQSAVISASAAAPSSAPAAISAPAATVAAATEITRPAVNGTNPAKSNGAQPAKAEEAKPTDKKADAGYAAQVGAYSNAATAKQELEKLKKWGFKAYTEKAGDKIRVRVGPYAERSKAEKVVKLLEKHGLHPSIVSAK